MLAKGIQQTCDKPKEFPSSMRIFAFRFLMKSQFLLAIQGLESGNRIY